MIGEVLQPLTIQWKALAVSFDTSRPAPQV